MRLDGENDQERTRDRVDGDLRGQGNRGDGARECPYLTNTSQLLRIHGDDYYNV
jgi:hypothetical protein